MNLRPATGMFNFQSHWKKYVLLLSIFPFVISFVRVVQSGYPYPIGNDAAFFQHAGWYVTQGGIPYADIWDIKPPLVIYTTTLLSLLSFGNPVALHFFSILLTTSMAIIIVYLVGIITFKISGDEPASVVASISVLTLAGFHYLPMSGFTPKYFAIAFGLSGIYYHMHQKYYLGGILVALGGGFVQHASLFAIISLIIAYKKGFPPVKKSLSGMFIATILALLPIAVFGDFQTMIVEVVFAPFVSSEPRTVIEIVRKLGKGLIYSGFAAIPIIFGIYGISVWTYTKREHYSWIVVGFVFTIVQIFLLDFDSYPDLFYGLIFVSIGVGLFFHLSNPQIRKFAFSTIMAIFLISSLFLGGVGVITNESVYTESLDDSLRNSDTILHSSVKHIESKLGAKSLRRDKVSPNVSREGLPNIQSIYWQQQIPDTCHYRLSEAERIWMDNVNETTSTTTCTYPIKDIMS